MKSRCIKRASAFLLSNISLGGEIFLKQYLLGSIISALCFLVILVFDSIFYNNIMPLSAVISLLVCHAIIFKTYLEKRNHVSYWTFIALIIVSFILSMPGITVNQARNEVEKTYDITITEESTVPLLVEGWNPFEPNRSYFFKGNLPDHKQIFLMVNAESGRVIELE